MSTDAVDAEALLDSLVDANVLVPRHDGGELAMSEEFIDTKRQFDDSGSEATLANLETISTETASEETLVLASAIDEFVPEFDTDEAFRVATTVRRFEHSPKTSGVPSGVTPLIGDELPLFLEQYPAAVIYFWREGCEPCDAVREDLVAVVEEYAEASDVEFGAVYGPNHLEVIRSEYDVEAAPTLLFCVDGAVDSRLVGPYPTEAIQREVQIVTERADADA